MFCSKCGTKAIEGAEFCQNCGAKLIADAVPDQRDPAPAQPEQPQSYGAPSDAPKKKKSKKLPVILVGIVAVLAVAVIIFAALNSGGDIDYEATVRAYTPYASSQGLPYTCGEVFDRYIPNAEWNVRKADGVGYVEISGDAKGADKELAVTIQVETEGDRAVMNPISTKLDGEELSEDVFFTLFVAYDEKEDDLSDIEELIREVDLATRGGKLKGTFANEAAGISFRYPDWWVALDSSSEYEIVKMISPRNNGNHIASFTVTMSLDADPFGVFTGDESFVKKSVNEYHKFLDYGDVMLGDVPAKALRYQTDGLSGDDIVAAFGYKAGGQVYWVSCSYTESCSAVYGPIFEALMESYTVAAGGSAPSAGSVASMEEAQWLIDAWLLDHPMGDMAGAGNGVEETDADGTEYFAFELWEAPREFLGMVYVRKSDGYMTFRALTGDPLDLDRWYEEVYVFYAGGTEPDEALSFVMDGDEDSTFTLYSDGTFVMEVNLYVGYGTLFGSYEDMGYGIWCYVESRDFSGYAGDDISEFEMVYDGDHLVYRGEMIGSTWDGAIYYLW